MRVQAKTQDHVEQAIEHIQNVVQGLAKDYSTLKREVGDFAKAGYQSISRQKERDAKGVLVDLRRETRRLRHFQQRPRGLLRPLDRGGAIELAKTP